MNEIWKWLDGKKTLLIAAVMGLAVFAEQAGWITKEQHDALLAVLLPAGLATLRMAIK